MNHKIISRLSWIAFLTVLILPSHYIFADTTTTATTAPATSPSTAVSEPASQPKLQIDNITVDPRNDFVLEPGKAEIFVNPGDVVTKEIYVTDRVPGTTTFEVDVEDFIGSNDPNTPVVILDGNKSPYSAKDFISPAVKQFTLTYGQRVTIPVTITIPKDAEPGGYYSTVLISNQPSVIVNGTSTEAAGSTRIISRVGTLYFLRVNGNVTQTGGLSDLRIKGSNQLFYEKGPFTFEILYNNTGNVYSVPYGTLTIKNTLGSTIATLPVDAYFAMPDSLRYRDVEWDAGALLGRYTATIQLNRGYGDNGGIVDTKTIVFWVLPWKILTAVFIGIFIIIAVLFYIFSRFEIRKK